MAEYIDREALIQQMADNFRQGVWDGCDCGEYQIAETTILCAPAADVAEVKTLKEWLYAIAMNNVGAPIEDMASACEEIANRLDGLRAFAREEQ